MRHTIRLTPITLLVLTLFVLYGNLATPVPTRSQTCPQYQWGLLGKTLTRIQQERAAGIQYRMFSLSWRLLTPKENVLDPAYVERKRTELNQLRTAGFKVILGLGIHDVPQWLHDNYHDTYYVNQYLHRYLGDPAEDSGNANLVFNLQLRQVAARYIKLVFTTFGTNFYAVRVGGGRFGELTYPPAKYGGRTNLYWAFDDNALAMSPVPNWRPGRSSPNGEAGKFLNWYLGKLVEFQNWQISTVRVSYLGPIMVLYPSWGIRPGDNEKAIKTNLNGTSPAEMNGEIQRGYAFARQISAIREWNVIVTTTWLDAPATQDGGTDQRYWSPVKYLASLASGRFTLFGENTGHGQLAQMQLSVSQMKKYGLKGMMWFNAEELYSGQYATFNNYAQIIQKTNSCQ